MLLASQLLEATFFTDCCCLLLQMGLVRDTLVEKTLRIYKAKLCN